MKMIFVALFAFFTTVNGQTFGNGYNYTLVVSQGQYEMAWTVDEPNNMVHFAVRSAASGWIGLGFGPSTDPDHKGTDFYSGSSSVSPADYYSVDQDWPQMDSQQNIYSVSMAYVSGWTEMYFSRLIFSPDKKDYNISVNNNTKLFWAYALTNTNLQDGSHHETNTKGSFSINLWRDPSLSTFEPPSQDPYGVEYGNLVTTDPNYRLYWRVNSGIQSLDICIRAYTPGWAVVGFNPDDSAHQNTDMTAGWISGTTATVVDLWSTTYATPATDSVQNCYNTSVSQVNGDTVVRFSRLWTTGDTSQDKTINTGDNKVVWGYGPAPGINNVHNSNAKGMVMINWLSPPGITDGVTSAGQVGSVGSGTLPTSLPGPYKNTLQLSPKLNMYWSINTATNVISIALEGIGLKGWIGIAFSPVGHPHLHSDMVMGNSLGYVNDYWSNAITAPLLDKQQNIITWSCGYINGNIVVTFSRLLATPDTTQDNPISSGTETFAWAYHSSSTDLTVQHNSDSGIQALNIDWFTGKLTVISGTPLWTQVLFFIVPFSLVFLFTRLIFFRTFRFLFILRKPFSFQFQGETYNYTMSDAVVIAAWIVLCSTWAKLYGYQTFGKWNVIGIMLQYHLALLFIPACRNSVLQYLFGMSFDRTIKYHRWIGYSTGLVLLLHGAGNMLEWNKEGRFMKEFNKVTNIYGEFAFFIGCIIVAFAIGIFRRKAFEAFLTTHMLFPFFIIFAALHSKTKTLGLYMVPGCILYFIDRSIRAMKSKDALNCKSIQHVNGLTRLQMEKPKWLKYEGGQYMFIMIPTISYIEWHPFSIASSPTDDELTLCIRDAGGWTHKLLALAKKNMMELHPHVDGPYGVPSVDHFRFKSIIMLSGGVGAVPFISMIREILHKIKDGEKLKIEKVYFVWSVRNTNHWQWFEDTITEVMQHPIASKIIDFRIYASNIGKAPEEWKPKANASISLMEKFFRVFHPPPSEAPKPTETQLQSITNTVTVDSKNSNNGGANDRNPFNRLSQAFHANGNGNDHNGVVIDMENLHSSSSAGLGTSQVALAIPAAPASKWIPAVDPETGYTYYYNPITQESSWIDPTTRPALPPKPPRFSRAINRQESNFRATMRIDEVGPFLEKGTPTPKFEPSFLEGRPNFRKLCNEAIDASPHCDKFAVLACGPMGMVYDARKICFEISDDKIRGKLFHFHSETFEF